MLKLNMKLKLKQAFQVVFAPGTVFNRAYFFVAVPFFTSVILYVAQLDSMGIGLKLLLSLGVIILNFLFQLYLWSTQFFYAQQISANDWSDYGLMIVELFTDMKVKFKLLAIRLVWNLPAIILILVVMINSTNNFADTNLTTIGAGLQDPSAPIVSALSSRNGVGSILLLFIAVLYSQIIAEQLLTTLSQYQYAVTGSFKQAFNIRAIAHNFKAAWRELLVVLGLALLPDILLPIMMVILAFVLLIPVFGGLVLGFILGLYYLYITLYIGNIQGQIWQVFEQTRKQTRKE